MNQYSNFMIKIIKEIKYHDIHYHLCTMKNNACVSLEKPTCVLFLVKVNSQRTLSSSVMVTGQGYWGCRSLARSYNVQSSAMTTWLSYTCAHSC